MRPQIHMIQLDPSDVRLGSTLRPVTRFVAEHDGAEVASVVFGQAEIFEPEPLEYALARLSWADGRLDAARAVMIAAARSVPAGAEVYFPVSAAQAARCGIAGACGFTLFQEKEGFWWADSGQQLPEPAGLAFHPMSQTGRERFIPVIGRCLSATLDRADKLNVARYRSPEDWAAAFLDRHAKPAGQDSWFCACTEDGEPIGFFGLEGREGEPGASTLSLIGVLPEQRGRRFADQLAYAAYRAARAKGFTGVLSLVDVENHPMTAAMRRTGSDPQAHPWHKWLYSFYQN